MTNKKINIIYHSVAFILFALIFILSTAYAWYVTNKVVSANGVFGASASGSLTISSHAIYDSVIGDDGSATDKPNNDDPKDIGGLLSGEKVYYGVSLETKDNDNDVRDLTFSLMGINGGDFFTCEPTIVPDDELIDGEVDSTKYTKTNTTYGVYMYVKKDDGSLVEELVFLDLFADYNGEFYITQDSGIFYKNYIFEEQVNDEIYRYNACDVFYVQLDSIYLLDINGVEYKFSINGNLKISDLINDTSNSYGIYLDNYSIDNKYYFNRSNGLNKNADNLELDTIYNWNPSKYKEITVIYSINFDTSNLPEDIPGNAVSRKTLTIDVLNVVDNKVSG